MKRARTAAPATAEENVEFFVGSGNVFADLDLSNPDELLAKSTLVIEIRRSIESRRLTQSKAAELLGVDQPKISRLLRGDFKGFSMQRLMTMLTHLGRDIEIVVGPMRRSSRKGRITVVVA